jgi:hypothetical protein
MQHAEPFLSELNDEVVARTGRALYMPLPGVERRAKLHPKSTFIHEISPLVSAIGANEHRRALIARCVEHDLARRDDRRCLRLCARDIPRATTSPGEHRAEYRARTA